MPSVLCGGQDIMLYEILFLLIAVPIATLTGESSSSQRDLADSCNLLSDFRVNNTMIFAPVSNDGSALADSDVDVSLMLHVFLNSLAAQGTIIRSVDEWITRQRSENTSLLNTWIGNTGVNVSDIRFKVYLPSSESISLQDRINVTHVYSHLQNITTLNESTWKKLGRDNIYHDSTNVTGCRSNFSIWFNGSRQEVRISDTRNGPDFGESCLTSHWKCLCMYGLRKGDVFQFKFLPIKDGNISVSLFYNNIPWLSVSEPEEVYKSRNNNHGNYTLPKDGGYVIIIENLNQSQAAGYFNYNITYNCKNITKLIDDWLSTDLLNQQEINVLLNDIRVKPVLHGQYENTKSPFKIPGIVDSTRIVKELEYMPVWLAKVFDAVIQNEGTWLIFSYTT